MMNKINITESKKPYPGAIRRPLEEVIKNKPNLGLKNVDHTIKLKEITEKIDMIINKLNMFEAVTEKKEVKKPERKMSAKTLK